MLATNLLAFSRRTAVIILTKIADNAPLCAYLLVATPVATPGGNTGPLTLEKCLPLLQTVINF